MLERETFADPNKYYREIIIELSCAQASELLANRFIRFDKESSQVSQEIHYQLTITNLTAQEPSDSYSTSNRFWTHKKTKHQNLSLEYRNETGTVTFKK